MGGLLVSRFVQAAPDDASIAGQLEHRSPQLFCAAGDAAASRVGGSDLSMSSRVNQRRRLLQLPRIFEA
jgi:hypothetical protein